MGVGKSSPFFAVDVAGDINTDGGYRRNGRVILTNKGGANNISVGANAGRDLVSGSDNVFVGEDSGEANVSGRRNVMVGALSGQDSTSSDNVFIGFSAGASTESSSNVFVGNDSGSSNETGRLNVFLGNESGENSTSGRGNVFVGFGAGSSNTSGSNNVYIGRGAGSTLGSTSDQLFINNSTSNFPLIHGNFDTNDVTINGDLTVTGSCSGCSSDINLKKDIVAVADPLEKILGLRAVTFDWVEEVRENTTYPGRQLGLIAQDVERSFPELVGIDGRGMKFVRYQKLVAPLVGAIRQQQEEIEALRSLICAERPQAALCSRASY